MTFKDIRRKEGFPYCKMCDYCLKIHERIGSDAKHFDKCTASTDCMRTED